MELPHYIHSGKSEAKQGRQVEWETYQMGWAQIDFAMPLFPMCVARGSSRPTVYIIENEKFGLLKAGFTAYGTNKFVISALVGYSRKSKYILMRPPQ